MTSLTQKKFFGAAIRVTLALFLVTFGAGTALAQSNDEQVPFTITGSAVVTSVTKLPGGLLQVNFDGSGTATHLGDYTGSATRTQDNHGNFGTTAVLIGANEKDSVFLSVSGRVETSKDKCVNTSIGTFTVTGGTGAFANATGGGIFTAQLDLCIGAKQRWIHGDDFQAYLVVW
jgi:hypothetical protein